MKIPEYIITEELRVDIKNPEFHQILQAKAELEKNSGLVPDEDKKEKKKKRRC